MVPTFRAALTAAASLALWALMSACAPPTPATAPPSASAATLPTQSPRATLPPASAVSPSTTAGSTNSAQPSATASGGASQAPVATVVPGSSLNPSLSDAGIAGRLTIVDDARNNWSGTHEILGRKADGSDCSYSLSGDEFTAVAWFDAAPNGMIHQMSVSVPADEMPANDGETRQSIVDGSVYTDFSSDTGFGTAYEGAAGRTDGGSSSIAIQQMGKTLVFTFTGTTWDKIDFSGQLICVSVGS